MPILLPSFSTNKPHIPSPLSISSSSSSSSSSYLRYTIYLLRTILLNLLLLLTCLPPLPQPIQAAKKTYLQGCGATLPGEVYEAWIPSFESYRKEFIDIDVEYFGTGSGEALNYVVNKVNESSPFCVLSDVSFVGSDIVLGEDAYGMNKDLRMVPILGGTVLLGYNLKGVYNLTLSKHHIIGIYNGTYKYWNDSHFQSINSEQLPNALINVIARSDTSGTTQIFTETLSHISNAWKRTYGNFSTGMPENGDPHEKWPRDVNLLYGKTNRGVSGVLISYANSIGYISAADANIALLKSVRLVNDDDNSGNGNVVVLKVDMDRVKDSMIKASSNFTNRMTVSLSKFVDEDQYPFIGYTYLVFNSKWTENCDKIRELVRFFHWITTNPFPQNDVKDFNMAPLPSQVTNLIIERVIKNITCAGKNVLQMALDQKSQEELSKQKWRIPVFIAIPIVLLCILGLVTYLIVQQVRLRRALLSDDWKIPIAEIHLKWTKSQGVLHNNHNNNHNTNNDKSNSVRNFQSMASLTASVITNFSYTGGAGGGGISRNVISVGIWKDKQVCLRPVPTGCIDLKTIENRKCLLYFRDKINHFNLALFYGVTFTGSVGAADNNNRLLPCFVSDHPPKGTLRDVVQDDRYKLDVNIQFSLSLDVVSGLNYLHSQNIIHGRLTSDCCAVDQKWNVRLLDWEYEKLSSDNNRIDFETIMTSNHDVDMVDNDTQLEANSYNTEIEARMNIWSAPEILHGFKGGKPSDVYSAAIILVEIFTREDPFQELVEKYGASRVVDDIKLNGIRPDLSVIGIVERLQQNYNVKYKQSLEKVTKLLPKCWQTDDTKRLTSNQLYKELKYSKPSKLSVMDCMMEALEEYVTKLEEKVKERTAELEIAHSRTESLLHQILPPSVAKKLSNGQIVHPEKYDTVTIFFSDIVGFTSLSAESSPLQIVSLLNNLYSIFDRIIDKKDVYKVETIGDAYMVVSGLPNKNGVLHAGHICEMSLDFLASVKLFKIQHKPDTKLQLRAGIHSGSVVAGVVGEKMPRYCLFGDTVNTASRMESTSEPLRIQVSGSTKVLLDGLRGGFQTTDRGVVHVKGKGDMNTFWLDGKFDYVPYVPVINT